MADEQLSYGDVDRQRRIRGIEWTDEGWTQHGRLLDFGQCEALGLDGTGRRA